MKLFKTSCKDKLTGMEMIASEITFNQSCCYLESKIPSETYLGCESLGTNSVKIKFKSRNFVYDEERGYLLGE